MPASTASYDVVIVGGAVVGSATAYFLAENPDFTGSVLVIEKDWTYQRSATALSSSSIRHQFSNAINVQVSQFGTEFIRNFGMSWGMGGWLLFPFLQKVGPHAAAALKQRVADELKTTFASHYAQRITLAQVLQKDTLLAYSQRATASKYLIEPSRGA